MKPINGVLSSLEKNKKNKRTRTRRKVIFFLDVVVILLLPWIQKSRKNIDGMMLYSRQLPNNLIILKAEYITGPLNLIFFVI